MGLDMYLKYGNCKMVKTYFEELTQDEQKECDFPLKEIGYWRKANAIRRWFVDVCGYSENGNCEYVEVSKRELERLKETCEFVLKYRDKAPELLPTSSGFFFGNTDYDDLYFETLEETIKICENALQTVNWDTEVVMYTDWW
jgi:hypothetical protein